MAEMKKIFWAGTEHWEERMRERAAMSGRMVLSDFTRAALDRFRAR
jgi:methylglutaconyl-CoA hydratase